MTLIRNLISRRPAGSIVRVSVIACSNGAEVYSIVWAIRSMRPDLKLVVTAVDISSNIVEIAKAAVYPLKEQEVTGPIFERLTEDEMWALFDREGDQVRVRKWIRDGIDWRVGDATSSELVKDLGPQDFVIANKFLCHMSPSDAERCLRNVAKLLDDGGYLFVSGIDLNVRTKVAKELGWQPVRELTEQIHDGDVSVRRDWPWRYWGLEPINSNRKDAHLRYASVFELRAKRSNPDVNRYETTLRCDGAPELTL